MPPPTAWYPATQARGQGRGADAGVGPCAATTAHAERTQRAGGPRTGRRATAPAAARAVAGPPPPVPRPWVGCPRQGCRHAVPRTAGASLGAVPPAAPAPPRGHSGAVPEGDTVFQTARSLDQVLAGATLVHGRLNVPAHATADLAGAVVLGTATHGKHLLTRLRRSPEVTGDGEEHLTLHTHRRMDGDWVLLGPGRRLPRRADPDVRVLLVTDAGATAAGLRMPVVELLRTDREHEVIGHLGPDLLHADFDGAEAVRRFTADPTRPLAATLLDQRVVAGLGNLWANELCYLLGVSPWTPVGEVDPRRVLTRAARALRFSANNPGAYQVTTGDTRAGRTHWVAGMAGKPCWRCGTAVRMVPEVPGDAGRRRTWWCPRCQPGPGPDR